MSMGALACVAASYKSDGSCQPIYPIGRVTLEQAQGRVPQA